MRRQLRTLALVIFVAGIVVVLVGSSGSRFQRSPSPSEAEPARPKSKLPVYVGLGMQALGVVGYLIMLSIPRRRHS